MKSFTSGNTEADDQIISTASLYCLQLEELLSVEAGMWLSLQKPDKGSVPKIFGWSHTSQVSFHRVEGAFRTGVPWKNSLLYLIENGLASNCQHHIFTPSKEMYQN